MPPGSSPPHCRRAPPLCRRCHRRAYSRRKSRWPAPKANGLRWPDGGGEAAVAGDTDQAVQLHRLARSPAPHPGRARGTALRRRPPHHPPRRRPLDPDDRHRRHPRPDRQGAREAEGSRPRIGRTSHSGGMTSYLHHPSSQRTRLPAPPIGSARAVIARPRSREFQMGLVGVADWLRIYVHSGIPLGGRPALPPGREEEARGDKGGNADGTAGDVCGARGGHVGHGGLLSAMGGAAGDSGLALDVRHLYAADHQRRLDIPALRGEAEASTSPSAPASASAVSSSETSLCGRSATTPRSRSSRSAIDAEQVQPRGSQQEHGARNGVAAGTAQAAHSYKWR